MRKVIAVIFILLLLVGLAYAGDAKKEDKDVLKDDSTTVDKTKETLKEIDKGIQVRDTSADIAKYDVLKEKDKITISKTDTVKDKKVAHTKTKLVMDEKTARSIDIDNDGKFGYLRKVNGQVVDIKVVTLAELTTGIDATFSDIVIDGFAGSYTKTGSSQAVSTKMSLGQSFNSSKTSALLVNISTTSYSDPYTEIAAMNPIAWYRFDEGSGTLVQDHSGNGYNGTASGGMAWTTGKYNGAGDFDSVDGNVEIPDAAPLRLVQNSTVFAWIYPRTFGETQGRIIAKGTTTTSTNGYQIGVRNTGELVTTVNGNSITMGAFPNGYNHWYLVEVDFTTSYIRSYVNNVLLYNGLSYPRPNVAGNISIGNRPGYTDRTFDGIIDNVIILNGTPTTEQRNVIYYDFLQQLQAKTNANTTYSTMWNSTSNNPLTLPISSLDGLISSIQFKVPTTVVQNGVTIYNYNQTAAPFTATASVLFTDDITEVTDSHTALLQTVNITHTSTNTADNGSLIPYSILDGYDGTATFQTNNTNATISRNETAFVISTGYLPAGSTYYYLVEIPNPVEEMLWSDWDPTNETCNAKVQIGNSTPYTTWNITTYNVTAGNVYSLYNPLTLTNAFYRLGTTQASLICTNLSDQEYWIKEQEYLPGTMVNITYRKTSGGWEPTSTSFGSSVPISSYTQVTVS